MCRCERLVSYPLGFIEPNLTVCVEVKRTLRVSARKRSLSVPEQPPSTGNSDYALRSRAAGLALADTPQQDDSQAEREETDEEIQRSDEHETPQAEVRVVRRKLREW